MQEAGLRAGLIAAAAALLERDGAEISLRGVARAAGVSAMAPYRHFADKAALLGAVADQGFADLRARLCAADAGGVNPVAALVAQGMAYVDMALDCPALFRLMFAGPRTAARSADCDMAAYRVLADRVATITADAADAATAAWGIVHGLAMLALDGRLPPDRAACERVLTLFARGLTPVSPAPRHPGAGGARAGA